ncbi:MAG: hypothetical protein SCALA702_19660 [Melioribacteraceae bacterium]|nr:MAG: hypothetical protein SCALA702_19660 [Melioribacteraceae bacterium]
MKNLETLIDKDYLLSEYLRRCNKIFLKRKFELIDQLKSGPYSVFQNLEYFATGNDNSFIARIFKTLRNEFNISVLFSSVDQLRKTTSKLIDQHGELDILVHFWDFSNHRDIKSEIKSDFKFILEQIPLAILIRDTEGKNIYFNKYEIMKEKEKLHTGQQELDTVNSGVIEQEVLDTKESYFYKETLFNRYGNEIRYSVLVKPFLDQNENIIGTITLSDDITESDKSSEELTRRIEDLIASNDSVEDLAGEFNILNTELNLANEKLNELNSQKDKLFSIIGHDLKNPAGSLKNFLEMLEEDFDEMEDSEKIELIHYARESADKLLQLLLDLFEWGRLSKGVVDIEKISLKPREIVADIFELLEPNAREKSIILTNKVSDTTIESDKYMLNTVLRNLVNNAIKFTPAGGKITVGDKSNKNSYNIYVNDTGVGIPSEKIGELFRVDQTTSTYGTNNEKGTGLGLPICKEFVEKCGGTIQVESELKAGSTFIVQLPALSN